MKKVILMGGGKFAGLIYAYFKNYVDFIGYLDDVYDKAYIEDVYDIPKMGKSQDIDILKKTNAEIVVAIGVDKNTNIRRKYYRYFKAQEVPLATLVHSSAQVFTDEKNIGQGTIVQVNAVIDPQVKLGENCVVGRTAVISHDSSVGNNTFVSPGVILNGSVNIGDDCFIGTGSVVIQNINIGNSVVIGASSCVIRDAPDNCTLLGVPASVRKEK